MTRIFTAALLLALAETALASDLDGARYTGSLSCAAASCHARVEPLHQVGSIQRQEYLHFLNDDPHAQAAHRLSEPRYLHVLARLAPEKSAQDVHLARCANCHDPLGQASELVNVPLGRGIGCESCHGAARDWIATHSERGVSRERLTQRGMVDTRHLFSRARACASCHVGNAENDVNHDLFAAGHPPLRFELAAHQASIERKHWDDARRRQAEPNYEVELWAAGRIASAEAALSLLASRAEQAAHGQAPWPEFAESNCLSCHQPLLAIGTSRGVPMWQGWNVMFAGELLPQANRPLTELRSEMERSLVPDAGRAAVLAAAARDVFRQCADSSHWDAAAALTVLQRPEPSTTWDRACQELAALLAAERALADAGRVPALDHRRIRSIAAALSLLDTSSQLPRAKNAGLAEAGAELSRMRQELAATKP